MLRIYCFITVLFFYVTASTQPYKGEIKDSTKVPVSYPHYESEYTFDVCTNPSLWQSQTRELNASFVTTDKKYFRTEVPEIEKSVTWEVTGWKGERVNAQILVWSVDTLNQVRVEVSDLKNSAGKSISNNNIQLDKVCYVMSNYPYNAKGFDCGPSPYKSAFLMPDRFETFNRFDVPGKTVRPVWLAANIPANAEAGMYTGTVIIKAADKKAVVMNIRLNVQKQILPSPRNWHHRLDLWQNPWVLSQYYHVKPWGDEHKSMLKKHLQLYADAGGTFITTYGVHSPWADNQYVLEEAMIEWIKQKDGAWKFDYSIFDQYVELAMSVGIDEAITIYTPIPWGNRFRYINEETGKHEYQSWTPETEVFKSVWNVFLNDLKKHLTQKGWLNKTYIGINENPMEQTLAAVKVVKQNWPGWKITYAGDWHKELDTLLDDYCYLYGKESTVEKAKERAAKGFTTTYYVCCNPDKPNNFVFSPPVEGRWIGWYTSAHHYDGFLRWAYDAWPQDPVRDARFGSWGAGDSYLIYPGGNSGIRYEKLREGIVDYEKIRILREKAVKSNNKKVKELIHELDTHLAQFVTEKTFDTEKMTGDLDKGKQILRELSELL